SIAVDASGDVHIAYGYSTTPKKWRVADWTGAGFAAPMGGNPRGKVQAPTAFRAASANSTSIAWRWADNSSNELGFSLYGAATSTGPFTLIAGTTTIAA